MPGWIDTDYAIRPRSAHKGAPPFARRNTLLGNDRLPPFRGIGLSDGTVLHHLHIIAIRDDIYQYCYRSELYSRVDIVPFVLRTAVNMLLIAHFG